jgi:hypothetical protein
VAINTLNRQLTTRIPNNFIDRAALVANANQTGMDQADRAADVVPGSLRVDSQHLSSGGYRIVAHQVGNSFVATAGRNQIRYLESESQRSASNDTAGKSLMADKQPFAGASRMAFHGRTATDRDRLRSTLNRPSTFYKAAIRDSATSRFGVISRKPGICSALDILGFRLTPPI